MNFLPGWFPAGAMAASIPASLSFIASTADDANQTTYSFASQSLGVADGTRRIVIVCHWHGSSLTLNSATITGIAATIHIQATSGNSNVGIISALVPSGTSGTIAMTLSGGALRARIAVYRATGGVLLSPHATMTDNTLSGAVLSGTINIPAVGWVVAGSTWAGVSGTTFTYVGVTEQYDATVAEAAGIKMSGGFNTGLALQSNRTVSATISNATAAAGALAAMSWG